MSNIVLTLTVPWCWLAYAAQVGRSMIMFDACHTGWWKYDIQVARSMEKLQALEAEVKRRHGCRVLIIQVTNIPVGSLDLVS